MLKGGGVVEVSDDDDGDFEPLPLRLSQVSVTHTMYNVDQIHEISGSRYFY